MSLKMDKLSDIQDEYVSVSEQSVVHNIIYENTRTSVK